MSQRGVYGKTYLGGTPPNQGGSSIGAWLLGGLVLGGAVLWAKNQSDQLEKLYTASDLPYQSFPKSLRLRAGELSAAAGEKLQGLSQRLGSRKEPSVGQRLGSRKEQSEPRNGLTVGPGGELDDDA